MQLLANKIIKSLFFILLFINSLCCFAEFSINNIPQPAAYVNDYADLLSNSDFNQINSQLEAFAKKTGNQIVVAIFPGQVPVSIEEFSTHLEEQWKIGEKGKDNGVLLVIFPEARQLRIEVGYGLEDKIPDTIANSINTNTIIPFFKQKQFAEGIKAGVHAIIQAIDGNYINQASSAPAVHKNPDSMIFLIICILFGFFTGFGIGPLIALGACISFFQFIPGFMIWLGAFNIYMLIYHLCPKRYQFNHPLRFLLGGFKGLNISTSSGDSSDSSSSSGGFSGGGGSSGGGGASGSW